MHHSPGPGDVGPTPAPHHPVGAHPHTHAHAQDNPGHGTDAAVAAIIPAGGTQPGRQRGPTRRSRADRVRHRAAVAYLSVLGILAAVATAHRSGIL
ncbi:hypothetical protein [Streptomyces sp. NPDC051546]|uniref:hypothetical protein n=1 Tax=Streptomyces sp. NPDC051546 TaxID=3365655 RepID=UPI0037B1D123